MKGFNAAEAMGSHSGRVCGGGETYYVGSPRIWLFADIGRIKVG